MEFEHRSMSGARFRDVDLGGARFRDVNLTGVVMRGAYLVDVSIDGDISNVVVNGVDVVPLVEAELNRRDPDRAAMKPADPDGFRVAWRIVAERWAGVVARARELDPALLHESVDGEWSFVQTLRHLVHATELWVHRALLGDPRPWHPLSLPFDQAEPHPEIPWDREARPSLDEVLAVREDRQNTVRAVLADLTPERLAAQTTPVDGPGYPPARAYPVRQCLLTVLNEEWEHRVYAERDLAILMAR
jgi:uncharacterized damage-inducible protein DinB